MGIAYKLFRIRGGKLHPLYVDASREIPIGTHLDADEGPRTPGGKVRSKLGELAFRPGWHLTEIPFADHIGRRMPDGSLAQAADTVWCEVRYDDAVDYNPAAKAAGKLRRDQCLRTVPKGGSYWYTTNASAKVRWLISGGIEVLRILEPSEVDEICRAHGIEPQPREQSGENPKKRLENPWNSRKASV